MKINTKRTIMMAWLIMTATIAISSSGANEYVEVPDISDTLPLQRMVDSTYSENPISDQKTDPKRPENPINGQKTDSKRPENPISDQKTDPKRPENPINDQKRQILELIRRNPTISRMELAKCLGLHNSSIKRRLEAMVTDGYINRVGSDKGGYWEVIKPIP
ncbi:MAG: winged helix-turn-helix transcriptional regulator [Muribaculaceae bacterium]|nr:winged helix-turn-helix transcriptional regulator [Muribaculaceae bacterium]